MLVKEVHDNDGPFSFELLRISCQLYIAVILHEYLRGIIDVKLK